MSNTQPSENKNDSCTTPSVKFISEMELLSLAGPILTLMERTQELEHYHG